MPMEGRRASAARIAAEGLVLFASVALALVADDWRETRGDREEVAQSLELIARDLDRDSTLLARVRSDALELSASAQWLLSRWAVDANPDTMVVHLNRLRYSETVNLSRAGFEGLQASNGLRLLESEGLRASLFQYYEVDQPFWSEYINEVAWPLRLVLNTNLASQLETYHVAQGRDVAVRGSWAELTSDRDIENALSTYWESITWVGDRLRDFETSNSALNAQVRLEIVQR